MKPVDTQEIDPLTIVEDHIYESVGFCVDNEDCIRIKRLPGNHPRHTIFEIVVPPKDVGLVIGANGCNIKAIRQLAAAAGRKYRIGVTVNVLDGKGRAN